MQNIETYRNALNFVVLKAFLERPGIVCAAYGFLACIYGIPKDHHTLYLVHFLLGVLLIAESVGIFARPHPLHTKIAGSLLIATGVWVIIMSQMNATAGGSPLIFTIWGVFIGLIGLRVLSCYNQFAHLNTLVLPKQLVAECNKLVKQLVSANIKKQQDAIVFVVKLPQDSSHFNELEIKTIENKDIGQWKARLLSDTAVFMQGNARQILVARKCSITVSEDKNLSDQQTEVTINILDVIFTVRIAKLSLERLENWLST